jgi:hypothetical protein
MDMMSMNSMMKENKMVIMNMESQNMDMNMMMPIESK